MANGETTEFSAKVDTDAYNEFKENFPQYGAVSWFINNALVAFNEEVRKNPEHRKLIDNAIAEMLDRNRNVTLTT